MFKHTFLSILFCIAFSINSHSQSETNLKDINKVWAQFYLAFETLDYEPMAEIHSKKLIRISGGQRILDYTTYINNYKSRFKSSHQNNDTNTIALRFLERINNDSTASERGIYKLTINKDLKNEKNYFGKFHVLFVKENNNWKILMDYDSTEGNTIGETNFLKAQEIDNLEPFVKQ
jgi:hypothetical protein